MKGIRMAYRKKQPISEQLIEASDLSRYRISQETGIAQSTLSEFVNGNRWLSLQNIEIVCELLELELKLRVQQLEHFQKSRRADSHLVITHISGLLIFPFFYCKRFVQLGLSVCCQWWHVCPVVAFGNDRVVSHEVACRFSFVFPGSVHRSNLVLGDGPHGKSSGSTSLGRRPIFQLSTW